MPGLIQSAEWKILPEHPQVAQDFWRNWRLPSLAGKIMAARGFEPDERARAFFLPNEQRDWHDPYLLPNMKPAALQLKKAIDAGKKIAVFGDFDVDGISASALLTEALEGLGARVKAYIPNRFTEGYGLSIAALERVLADEIPDLVITVDNGIASKLEVAWLLEKNIEVIITDHHEAGDLVPEDVWVVNPKLEKEHPSRDLAGAGVALKLVQVLSELYDRPDFWRPLTELACLGTLSDLMPLTEENRWLVTDGVSRMRKSSRVGLRALAQEAGKDISTIKASDLPFSLIPRLNAAGRMAKVGVSFELLRTQDHARATELARLLESINTERKNLEKRDFESALPQAQEQFSAGARALVVAGEGWYEGVKGIVASRLVQKFGLPTLVFSIEGQLAKGSGRSVGSIDLFSLAKECSGRFVRFGGHAQAVGITLKAADIDAFRQEFNQLCSTLPLKDFIKIETVDVACQLQELTVDQIRSLDEMEPFGPSNPKPRLALCGVRLCNRVRFGAEKQHFRCKVTNGSQVISAVMFSPARLDELCSYEGLVDLVFEAEVDSWRGFDQPKLLLRDVLFHEDPRECGARSSSAGTECQLGSRAGGFGSGGFGSGGPCGAGGSELGGGGSLELGKVSGASVSEEPEAPLRRRVSAVSSAGSSARACPVSSGTDPSSSADPSAREQAFVRESEPSQHKGSSAVQEALQAVFDTQKRQASEFELACAVGRVFSRGKELFPTQLAALKLLAEQKNCLCLMPTGRGKSLVFHSFAAQQALCHGQLSIFIYPLRALINDQAAALARELAPLGLSAVTLTGAQTKEEQKRAFEAVKQKKAQIILSTPEFLQFHKNEFQELGKISFAALDEAHHLPRDAFKNRGAYLELAQLLRAIGVQTLAAFSATMPQKDASFACGNLGIDPQNIVVDQHERKNLFLFDVRNVKDREVALASIIAGGEKSIIYVNSRAQAMSLTRLLRHRLPDFADAIAFYHAGLESGARKTIEDYFRAGLVSALVATSAFGEGVNIPDVRNVVLYSLPLDSVQFNQMCGRAGRDGECAKIHLLFGRSDCVPNYRLLSQTCLDRDALALVWRSLAACSEAASFESACPEAPQVARASDAAQTAQASEAPQASRLSGTSQASEGARSHQPSDQGFILDFETFLETPSAQMLESRFDQEISHTTLSCASLKTALAIFSELGLLQFEELEEERFSVQIFADHPRTSLEKSVRYLEGSYTLVENEQFNLWALGASREELLFQLRRPITP